MRENVSFKAEDILNILDDLNQMVVSLDKIASGFENTDTCSSAIHLFLLEEDVLDKLALMRKHLSGEFTNAEYNEYCGREINYYKPPYEKTKEELLTTIKKILGRS